MLTDEQREALERAKKYFDGSEYALAKEFQALLAASAAPAEGREADVMVYLGGQREPHSIAFDDADRRKAVDERAALADAIEAIDVPDTRCISNPEAFEQGFNFAISAAAGLARAALATAPTKERADFERRLYMNGYLAGKAAADTAPTMSEGAGEWDGDSEESRAAFRAYDDKERITSRSSWQIWRDACAWQAAHPASEPITDAARERNEWDKVLRFSKYIISRLDTTEVMRSAISGPAYDAAERAVFIRNIAAAEIERIDRAEGKA